MSFSTVPTYFLHRCKACNREYTEDHYDRVSLCPRCRPPVLDNAVKPASWWDVIAFLPWVPFLIVLVIWWRKKGEHQTWGMFTED